MTDLKKLAEQMRSYAGDVTATHKLADRLDAADAEIARLKAQSAVPGRKIRFDDDSQYDKGYADGWNACRAAMLKMMENNK